MSCKKMKVMKPRICNRDSPFRFVEPFSIASFYQQNIEVYPLCKLNVFEENKVNSSLFRTLLLRGDLPCQRSFGRKKDNKQGTLLLWKVAPADLDYCYYFPLFFNGLSESTFPYNIIASYAIHDLLNTDSNLKVLAVIPQIINPIKNALNTKNREVIAATLRVLQHLCMCSPCVAEALVPYYRQFLSSLNLFCNTNVHKMDRIDYSRIGRLGDIIDKTLMTLERCGGSNAYINIKYMIPTYESCVNN